MRRREFIKLLGGTAAARPLAARAQQSPKPARLGYFAPTANADLLAALYSGLRDFGYVEGQNLAIDHRYLLGQSKTYDEIAAELVRLNPDVIVVVGTPPALAAKRQTATIPIIMAPAADPLRTGLVASLSRPGGNVSGVTLYGSELARKRVEVLKEELPESGGSGCSKMPVIRRIVFSGKTRSRPAPRSAGVPPVCGFGPQRVAGGDRRHEAGRFRWSYTNPQIE